MKTKLEIYALAVCFSAVLCLLIAGGVLGYSLIEILKPEITMSSWSYERHQSNDKFLRHLNDMKQLNESAKANLTDEELTKRRLESYALELQSESRNGLQALIQSFIYIILGFIVLLVHWRIARSARTSVSNK